MEWDVVSVVIKGIVVVSRGVVEVRVGEVKIVVVVVVVVCTSLVISLVVWGCDGVPREIVVADSVVRLVVNGAGVTRGLSVVVGEKLVDASEDVRIVVVGAVECAVDKVMIGSNVAEVDITKVVLVVLPLVGGTTVVLVVEVVADI